nr:hypothetical protein [Nostoc sp. 'Peltigera malacea cyanobiont' DB3992]
MVNSGFSGLGAVVLDNGVDSEFGVTSGSAGGVIIFGTGDSIISGSVGDELGDGAIVTCGVGVLLVRRLKNPPNLDFLAEVLLFLVTA